MKTERPGGELEKVIRSLARARYRSHYSWNPTPDDELLKTLGFWEEARFYYDAMIAVDEERTA